MPDSLGAEPAAPQTKDYFSEREGLRFAGMHLLLDLWGAKHLTDAVAIESALREAAQSARATILHGHFHVFTPHGGVTGVLLLAESHISIHTWPEHGFAAIDLFMCAGCDPHDGIATLKRWFEPERFNVTAQRRGLLNKTSPSEPPT